MKRGFTLIELLAVIVILAIISLIAVPIVVNIINDSKENSLKRSIDLYMNSVKTSITKESMNPNFPKGEITCTILNEKSEGTEYDKDDLICIEDNDENISSYVKIDIKGETPVNGIIKLNNGKIIEEGTWIEMSNSIFYKYESNIIKKLTEDKINNLKSRLPKEYQEVEYIESTGTQYIDTEYVFKNKPRITGEIMIRSGADLDIMGTGVAKEGCFIIDFFGSTLYYRYSSSGYTNFNTNIGINQWYTFEFSDKVKVNGLEKGTIESYDFSNNQQTFYIGKGRTFGFARFKEIKMYDGEKLVRHLIPCYRKSDEKGGMFDVENQKFYTDKEGKDSFYYYTPKYELPNKDSELEYIESTGIQYIDTKYVFKNKPRITGEIMIRSGADLDIMGTGEAKEGCFIIDFRGSTLYYRYSSSGYTNFNTNIGINQWYTFEFSDKVKVNGIEKGTIKSYDFSNNQQTFYIGKGRNNGHARFKEIKMYDGDILVRDLVPYYKKNINKIGMLDKLNNIFYPSEGTEEFLNGPYVN